MFQIAPGTLTALSRRLDNRAYYTFSGDLSQMGAIEEFLRARGFPVVKSDVYPGFQEKDLAEYVRALRLIYKMKLDGWWNQEQALIEHHICTPQEFLACLHAP